jgi:hypothetical protein
VARIKQVDAGEQSTVVCDFVLNPPEVTFRTLWNLYLKEFWRKERPDEAGWDEFITCSRDYFDNVHRMEPYLTEWALWITPDQDFIARHALWVAVLLRCPQLHEDTCVHAARLWLISGTGCSHNPDHFDRKRLELVPLDVIRSRTTEIQTTADQIAEHLREIRGDSLK